MKACDIDFILGFRELEIIKNPNVYKTRFELYLDGFKNNEISKEEFYCVADSELKECTIKINLIKEFLNVKKNISKHSTIREFSNGTNARLINAMLLYMSNYTDKEVNRNSHLIEFENIKIPELRRLRNVGKKTVNELMTTFDQLHLNYLK